MFCSYATFQPHRDGKCCFEKNRHVTWSVPKALWTAKNWKRIIITWSHFKRNAPRLVVLWKLVTINKINLQEFLLLYFVLCLRLFLFSPWKRNINFYWTSNQRFLFHSFKLIWQIECLLKNMATHCSSNPCTWRILICLTIVLLPLSPAPWNKTKHKT